MSFDSFKKLWFQLSITTILVKQTNPQKIKLIDSSPCVFSNWTRLLKSSFFFFFIYMPFSNFSIHPYKVSQPYQNRYRYSCSLICYSPTCILSASKYLWMSISFDSPQYTINGPSSINQYQLLSTIHSHSPSSGNSTVRSLLLIIRTQSTQSSVYHQSGLTLIDWRWTVDCVRTLSSNDQKKTMNHWLPELGEWLRIVDYTLDWFPTID